ncbi:xylulokinase [Neobacillus cucumis]|uniref:xylulokinase n=1 Tax=Neobacillus cucumis TaxID=1740721 RepID=UPI00285360B0|nr:FGGY family carbohydrate kinase [Neobacillus cucumis]MDR4949752.1 FGGY family carbohydrate kinase [Neobacillus cucumis]
MSHIIGIDIGTSGIKVGAMNKEGVLRYLEYQQYSLIYPEMGLVEIDLEDVWQKTKALLLGVWKQVETVGKVDAISLSTFCNSSVFLTENGESLHQGITYLDQRSRAECDWIKSTVGEDLIFGITKNRLEPGMYTVTTLLWFKNQFPEAYKKMYKWGNLSTFIMHKLTGRFVMDWTQSSYTGMYDIEKYEWSAAIYEKAGIDREKLPDVVAPSSIVGELILDEAPFTPVPVITGAADTACSTVALGIGVNEMFESVGTSNVLTTCMDNPYALDVRFMNRCHVIKDRWLSHGAMSFPGAAVQWFYEQFLKPEGYSKEILSELAQDSIPGAGGVFFLPYMQGERTPIWDGDARGVFAGIHLNSTKADMYRAVLEGCAFGLRQIGEIIKTKYQLHIDGFPSIGGGAKNREWARIKANVLNKKLHIKDISETAVLGACLMAGAAIGWYSSLENAANEISNNTVIIVEPEEGPVKTYDELYQVFNELYPSLQSFFALSSTARSRANKVKKVDSEVLI